MSSKTRRARRGAAAARWQRGGGTVGELHNFDSLIREARARPSTAADL